MINSDWSSEALYLKAKLYMERALMADRNSALFPFWASLGLELVGRATLSKVHPALIADPREGNHILHAFGFGSSKEPPKTIGAKTVFLRLQIIVPNFTPQDEKFCQSFINMRNEELHTGTPVFEDYSTNAWLTNFYKSIKVLLEHQAKTLIDFLGKKEADVAEQMISEYKEELLSKVKEKIKKFKDVFGELEEEERQSRVKTSKDKIFEFLFNEKLFGKYKNVKCPSCDTDSVLIGLPISQSEPRVHEDVVIVNNNLLPTDLKCFCCGLKLSGNGELVIANLGGQFALEEKIDPVDYYGIEYDPIEELRSRGYTMQDLARDFGGHDDYGND